MSEDDSMYWGSSTTEVIEPEKGDLAWSTFERAEESAMVSYVCNTKRYTGRLYPITLSYLHNTKQPLAMSWIELEDGGQRRIPQTKYEHAQLERYHDVAFKAKRAVERGPYIVSSVRSVTPSASLLTYYNPATERTETSIVDDRAVLVLSGLRRGPVDLKEDIRDDRAYLHDHMCHECRCWWEEHGPRQCLELDDDGYDSDVATIILMDENSCDSCNTDPLIGV